MPNFVPMYEQSDSEDRSLEAYVASFNGDFGDTQYHPVLTIRKNTYGYVLITSAFETFCSHKYRKAASVLQKYLHNATAGDIPQCLMAIGVTGRFDRDYAVWHLAKDTDVLVRANTQELANGWEYVFVEDLTGELITDTSSTTGPYIPPKPGSRRSPANRKGK